MRVEKLHKNIVEHKHSQYMRWLEREEELRNKPAARSGPGKSKGVKSKAVVSSGSDGDSESDEDRIHRECQEGGERGGGPGTGTYF